MAGWKLDDLKEYKDRRVNKAILNDTSIKPPSTPEADLLPNIPMDTTPKKSGISLPDLTPKIQSGLSTVKSKLNDFNNFVNPTVKKTVGNALLNASPLGMVNNVAKLTGTDLNGIYGIKGIKELNETHKDSSLPQKILGYGFEAANRVPLAQRIKVSAGNYLDNPAMNFDGSTMVAKSTGNKLLDMTADFAGGLAGQALIGDGNVNMLNATDNIAQYAGARISPKLLKGPGQLLPSMVRGATDAAAGTLLEDVGKGKGLKETATDTLTNAAFGAGLFGLGKIGSEVLQGRGADLITTSKNTYGSGINKIDNSKGLDFKQNGNLVRREGLQGLPAPRDYTQKVNELPSNNDVIPMGGYKETQRPLVQIKKERIQADLPIAQRDFSNVGNQEVKAIQYNHEELKPHIQQEAEILKGELLNSNQGTPYQIKENGIINSGGRNARVTSESIETMLDVLQFKKGTKNKPAPGKYQQLEKAFDDIIADHGRENNALAKKVELIIDDRLSNGYDDAYLGDVIPPDINYLNKKEMITGQPLYKNTVNSGIQTNKTPVQLPNKPQESVKPNLDINTQAVQNNVPMAAKQAINTPVQTPKYKHSEESISQLKTVEEIDNAINQLKEEAAATTDNNFKGLIMNLQIFAEKKKTELSKLYQSINKSEFIAPEVKAELKNSNEKMYAKDTNQRQWDDATANVKGDFEGTLSRITTKEAFDSADDVAEGFALIDELQKRGDYKSAAALAESMIPKSRKLGQAVQAHAIIGRLSPEGVLQYTARQYEKANTQLPQGKKIKLTEDKAKVLVEKSKEIQSMPDGRMKELAQNELLMKTMEDIPVTLARKISTIQAMAQLLNVKTTLRNILGNTAFNVAETISNLYAIPYDRAIKGIGKTGNKTVGLPELKAFGQGFKQRGLESIEEVHKGIDLNDYDKYNVKTKNVFKNPVLQKLEKTMGYTLKVPDEAFKGGIVQDSLTQQMKLAGVTTPTEEMIKQANKEAAFRTFQDDSLPAQLLQGAKELLNKVGIGNKIQGASGMKTREFGVGDLVIKYTKVPGNIIARTLEYSPLGFLKTVGLLHDAKVAGKLNQRDLAMTLGRATNGTMMIGMGVLMDRLGLLKSEDKDMDKDAKELDRAAGLGTYKLNLSALNRVVSSGSLDAQELKEGDVLTAYNWLQPVSTAFAIGAAINNELGKTDAKKSLASRVGSAGLEEVLDIPTLTIIQQMFYESQKTDSNAFDIMTVPIKQAIPGFIPSQARQIAQTVDPVYRDTKGDTGKQTFVNSLKANIPGLSDSLLPRISPTGEEKKNQLPLLNLFNPAQTTKYQPQEITPKLKQLEKLTGDVTFYPRSTAPKTFKDNKETIILNQTEKNTYLKTLGQETMASYNSILKGVDVEKLSEDRRKQLIKQLNSAIDKASDKAKKTIVEGRK